MQEWELAGFIDDSKKIGSVIDGIKVLGNISFISQIEGEVNLVIAVGNPAQKQALLTTISKSNVNFPILIHPTAIIQAPQLVKLGEGTVICAGAILTTSIRIGKHVLINLNVTIGHDTVVNDFSSIMPGANIAGEVSIGSSVLVGSGANIRNKISVGNSATVGMGSVVIRNVEDSKIVAGNPAKEINK
jgi:sugar O-acyltransferase (sialic acid O-acetyltransferase NeuD family)